MSKTIKIVTLALLAAAALIGTLVAVVFHMTSGMTETADNFFGSIKSKDFAKARTFLSEEFRANTDEQALKEYLSKSAILNFKEADWISRSVNNGQGELEGSVITNSGGNVPIKITFVKEGETWKIYSMQKPSAGVQSENSSLLAPTPKEQVELVKKSLYDFALSVEKRSMEHFHSTISNSWKAQITAKKLDETFGEVFSSGMDLSVVNPMLPIIDAESEIDENGILKIKGHYETTPVHLYFEQQFIYEGISWKLFGFRIYTE